MKAQPDRDDRLGVFRRLSAGLVVGISVLAAAIILLTALSIIQDYRDAMRQASAETQIVSRALEQHSERIFDAIRFRLRLVHNLIGPVDWDRIAADRQLHRALADLADRPFMHSVWLFDETGMGRASSRSSPALPVEVGDRDYFVNQRDKDNGIYVGRPITGRRTGDAIFSASIRIEYPDGRFAGIAAIFLNPGYFEAFYRDLQLRRGSVIELIRADGAFLIREPSIHALDDLRKSDEFLRAVRERKPAPTAPCRTSTGSTGSPHSVTWPACRFSSMSAFPPTRR